MRNPVWKECRHLVFGMLASGCLLACGSAQETSPRGNGAVDLPSSKQLLPGVPGDPQRVNSLPVSVALSPDRRWAVTVNAGYGTAESQYQQSLAVIDTQTGAVADFPDPRTREQAAQTLYSGLAFSADGRHLYGTMASLSDPEGRQTGDTGNGIVVYGFGDGKITREGFLAIPLQPLRAGRKTRLIGEVEGNQGVPFPAAVAVVPSRTTNDTKLAGGTQERLLVADNLSDDALLLDAATGKVIYRFDLSETDVVPSTYPVAVAVSHDGRRGFVALWNASEVVELDLADGRVLRKLPLLKPASATTPGTHPCALLLSGDGKTLYVSLSNRDAVAAVDVGGARFRGKGYFDTRLPGQSYFGAEPVAVAEARDGRRLYAANMGSNAIAVLDPAKLTPHTASRGMVEPIGFVPTEWMPTAVAVTGGRLLVTTAKGRGTGPNNFPQRVVGGESPSERPRPSTYIGTLLYGSVSAMDTAALERELPRWTSEVLTSNRMRAEQEQIRFAGGGNASRIRHVIYIIKENRTYDQIFGDLEQNGRPVGNGDRSLTMYGAAITPNQHKLALQFGVLDNFYDSGEVSGDGHVWSNAAIGTDYLERTWPINYRGKERSYDFEGVVAEGLPLEQHIPDVNEPASGYLWGNLARHGKSLYHFGEFIASTFCNEKQTFTAPVASQEGPMLTEQAPCARTEIRPNEAIPEVWGGGVNRWPWAIPLLASNRATKPELAGHFAQEQPDFNLRIPDQIRYEVFARHFAGWLHDREAGKDTMPNFVMLRFSNDHTAGTTPGGPTPRASVADNDLAVGRAVDLVSHSPFWDDTAFFILEDDAQNGADHVDAHRSLALVVSKYAPRGARGEPFVDHTFYSTVSVVRTMEAVLGLPPMNNNDAFSSLIASEFGGAGDQPPFTADMSNRDNGLIYASNPPVTSGSAAGAGADALASARMDFRHADRADARRLNLILWRDAMGAQTVPATLYEKRRQAKKDDDD